MTPADLTAKLDALLKLPDETEWVEFKTAKANFDSDDLGRNKDTTPQKNPNNP